jgi:hypothetical protein
MEQVSTCGDWNATIHRFPEIGEWLLLREDVQVGSHVYRAGTPIAKVSDHWLVGGCDQPVSENLDGRTCRAEYGGLSLHVVSVGSDGTVSHRRVGSHGAPECIPASRVISPPEQGRDKVYLAFGDQFYPLEYFGW